LGLAELEQLAQLAELGKLVPQLVTNHRREADERLRGADHVQDSVAGHPADAAL
jgi:hypothetical protein